jgi:hypothetical protein
MTNVDAVRNKRSVLNSSYFKENCKRRETIHHIFTERKEDYINILRHPENYRNAILQAEKVIVRAPALLVCIFCAEIIARFCDQKRHSETDMKVGFYKMKAFSHESVCVFYVAI